MNKEDFVHSLPTFELYIMYIARTFIKGLSSSHTPLLFIFFFFYLDFIFSLFFITRKSKHLPICLLPTFCRRVTLKIDDNLFPTNSICNVLPFIPLVHIPKDVCLFDVKNINRQPDRYKVNSRTCYH